MQRRYLSTKILQRFKIDYKECWVTKRPRKMPTFTKKVEERLFFTCKMHPQDYTEKQPVCDMQGAHMSAMFKAFKLQIYSL